MHRIPIHLQPFFDIIHFDLPPQYSNTADALIEAICIIDGKVRINKKYNIVIGKSPFKVPVVPTGTFIYRMNKKFICSVFDDYIFLDYLRLSEYDYPTMVVCILEELVHALMNVVEHPLVQEIVCLLYPYFFVTKKGAYRIREDPSQESLEK